MGEWSKSIGEKGEKITKFIFEEILGVNSLQENSSIDCQRGEKHKRKEAKGNRTTHGIDGIYYHESPMEDELLDIVLISSKYTTEYPKNPKSDFKSHMSDLAQAIECFKLSRTNNEISQSFSTVTKTGYTGVLVWLSHKDSTDYEVIPKVSNALLNSELEYEKIIIIDNSRINFLYETIYKTKKEFNKVDFVYHNSSLNQKIINLQAYGNKFPIEYLYSDIIILRVENQDLIEFLIYVNDDFDSANLAQLLSFTKSFDHLNAIDTTRINYLNYDELTNENQLKNVLARYSNYKLGENLIINKFPSDFRR